MSPYVDPAVIHDPDSALAPPSSWGDQLRENDEWFAEPPSCRVYHSTKQNLPTSTFTSLNADSEQWDSASMHSTSSNTSRITVPVAGKYLFIARVEHKAQALNARLARFLINGSTTEPFDAVPAIPGTTVEVRSSGSTVQSLSAGGYVEVQAWQNSGDTATVQLLEFTCIYQSR